MLPPSLPQSLKGSHGPPPFYTGSDDDFLTPAGEPHFASLKAVTAQTAAQVVSSPQPFRKGTSVDIDWDNVPEEYSDPEKARQLRDSLIFSPKTVGPKAPPQRFIPIEFLNYSISLLHDSRQLGWIKVDGVHQSLLAKLL